MSFPINPSLEDNPSWFLVQDPFGIRHPIISLLVIDNRTGRASGLGTAFRIDPFGQYLTAQHVLEDWLLPPRPSASVVGLLNPGLGYGTFAIQNGLIAISSAKTFRTQPNDRVQDQLLGQDSTRMTLDCMMLTFSEENPRLHTVRDFLPLRLSGNWPKVGDQVMALGFPELGCLQNRDIDDDILTERMYASVGRVREVLPHGREHRPWPTFAVDEHWPRGMSGGPVFNLDGEVIGLVSSSDEPGSDNAQSYAFWFAPIQSLQRDLAHVDSHNPGWVRGWAVVRNTPWHVAAMTNDKTRAEEICRTFGVGYAVRFGSLKAETDDFMNADNPSS
jgi:serine protease Do